MNKYLSTGAATGLVVALVISVFPGVTQVMAAAPEPAHTPRPPQGIAQVNQENADHWLYMPMLTQPQGRSQPPTVVPPPATVAPPPATITPTVQPPPATVTPTVPAPVNAGFFASVDWLTYNATTAVDAQGGVHLAFYMSDERHQNEPRNQAAYYTYCPPPASACKDPGKWSGLVQFSDRVNEVQIVATSNNQPRILIRRNGNRAYEYQYWECNQSCTEAQNWGGLFITEAAGVDINTATSPQHGFALDSQDRPRFIYSNGWGIGKDTALYYTFCDAADCTEPGSWKETNIHGPIEFKTVTADYASLVFEGDKPRAVSRLNLSGLPEGLYYYWCDENCYSSVNWGYRKIHHPEGRMWANWDLVLDAQGLPRVALYEPAPIDITVGGKLFYGWCDAACLADITARFQVVQVASGEGVNMDLALDPQGRTHMVYDAGQRAALAHLWCEAGTDCTQAGNWQRRILETSEQLTVQFPVASPLSCDSQQQAWLDSVPQATFDAQGNLIVAYDIKNVSVCFFSDPTRPADPPKSRVERLWWAVRWAFFARP